MTKSKFSAHCVYCGSNESVKEIIYGMPSEDFDKEKYEIGGCIPKDDKWICLECSSSTTGREVS